MFKILDKNGLLFAFLPHLNLDLTSISNQKKKKNHFCWSSMGKIEMFQVTFKLRFHVIAPHMFQL